MTQHRPSAGRKVFMVLQLSIPARPELEPQPGDTPTMLADRAALKSYYVELDGIYARLATIDPPFCEAYERVKNPQSAIGQPTYPIPSGYPTHPIPTQPMPTTVTPTQSYQPPEIVSTP